MTGYPRYLSHRFHGGLTEANQILGTVFVDHTHFGLTVFGVFMVTVRLQPEGWAGTAQDPIMNGMFS